MGNVNIKSILGSKRGTNYKADHPLTRITRKKTQPETKKTSPLSQLKKDTIDFRNKPEPSQTPTSSVNQTKSKEPLSAYAGLKSMVRALISNNLNQKYMHLNADKRKEALEDAAYAFYEKVRPEVNPLTDKEQKAMLKRIEKVFNKYQSEVKIMPQSVLLEGNIFIPNFGIKVFRQWKKADPKKALEEFAYVVMPNFSQFNPHKARLFLSFNPQSVGNIFEGLVRFVSEANNKELVEELKVMGPQEQGTRTDGAVIYLKTNNEKEVEKLVKELRQYIDEEDFCTHIPLGMRALAKGIASATRNPKSSSSHGGAMASLAAEIATNYWNEQQKNKLGVGELLPETLDKDKKQPENKIDLDQLIQKTLKERGFTPQDPSRLLTRK